jgi:hypothetical protein
MPKPKEKSNSQLQLEKEVEIIQANAERVRELLIRKGAEDLIPVLLSDLEELTMPVRELVSSPNGSRKSRK